jgi:hypothetical protein
VGPALLERGARETPRRVHRPEDSDDNGWP